MTRSYTDYSTFNWQDPWFAHDQDARIRVGGVFLNGIMRSDGITVGGRRNTSSSRSRLGHRTSVPRALRMLGLPRIFLPPRI